MRNRRDEKDRETEREKSARARERVTMPENRETCEQKYREGDRKSGRVIIWRGREKQSYREVSRWEQKNRGPRGYKLGVRLSLQSKEVFVVGLDP